MTFCKQSLYREEEPTEEKPKQTNRDVEGLLGAIRRLLGGLLGPHDTVQGSTVGPDF